MKHYTNFFRKVAYLLILSVLCISLKTRAQAKLELSFGDKAPPLAYSKWIKGKPVGDLKGDKLFLLEFWATWCKPCIASMPHLSELAHKYSDRMEVIAVNVAERTGDKPYDSVLPAVESFVEKNAEIMKFSVIADNNNKDMSKNYLDKAHIMGIPATILVKDNRILWIGHPMFLDSVLTEIFDGRYDFEGRKQKYEKELLASLKSSFLYKSGMASIDSAVTAKDYQKAVTIAGELMMSNPENTFAYQTKKAQLLTKYFGPSDVAKYINEMGSLNPMRGLALAEYVGNQPKLSADFHRVSIEYLEKSETKNTYYLDRLAYFYARSGDFKKAAATQARALVLLKEAAAKPESKISPETIKNFEEKTASYQGGKLFSEPMQRM